MDDVRIVRRRTHVWPVVIAIIVLVLVVAWAFFALDGAPTDVGPGAIGNPAGQSEPLGTDGR